MAKKKSHPLPQHLRLTPERKKKIAEQQQRLREAAIARGRLTPEARRMQLGMAHETSARAEVEMLESELTPSAWEYVKPGKLERLAIARSRLAEALALQGRYSEAAHEAFQAGDEDREREYTELWHAVWRDDDETCPCEPFVDGELSLTHDHVAEEVISQKHDQKLVPAIRCNQCGCVNVRPLPHELQQRQRAQAQAAGLIQGHSAESLKHNAKDVLAELTDRKVLSG